MANFQNLRRQKTLGTPPSIEEASENLAAPEIAPASQPAKPAPAAAQASPAQKTAAQRYAATAAADQRGRRRDTSDDHMLEDEPKAPMKRLDGRSMRRSGRTLQFATRVTPEFDARLRTIAEDQNMLIIEVLEAALDAYEATYK